MPHRNLICRLLFCAILSISVLNIFTKASASLFHQSGKPTARQGASDVFCPQSQLANDILVVLRTGATESLEKVPVHFRTTLRCVPHFVIHSDLDEEIEGHDEKVEGFVHEKVMPRLRNIARRDIRVLERRPGA